MGVLEQLDELDRRTVKRWSGVARWARGWAYHLTFGLLALAFAGLATGTPQTAGVGVRGSRWR